MSQKLLVVATATESLRHQIHSWDEEDSGLYVPGPIGLTPTSKYPARYDTILHAMADGWKLLAPPRKLEWTSGEEYEWWLVKD